MSRDTLYPGLVKISPVLCYSRMVEDHVLMYALLYTFRGMCSLGERFHVICNITSGTLSSMHFSLKIAPCLCCLHLPVTATPQP